MKKRQWQVIEDTGGGLHLFMFDDNDQVIALTSGYEHNPENLMLDIREWYMTGSVEGWEGLDPQPEKKHESFLAPEAGEVIAEGNNRDIEYHPGKMGSAGEKALGEFAKKYDHAELIGRAIHASTQGNITDHPINEEQIVVKSMAQVVAAFYADMCYGVNFELYPEDMEQWFARHGIEFQ